MAVITDTERDVKMMMLDDHLHARVAISDYELTLTTPPALSSHVGVDSLTHQIESYVSSRATVVTDMGAGVERDHLDRVVEDMAQAALDSGSPAFNPREASRDEIVEMYRQAF